MDFFVKAIVLDIPLPPRIIASIIIDSCSSDGRISK